MSGKSINYLPPVQRFNDTVGTIFRNCRMPQIEHRDAGLQKALTWLVEAAYRAARTELNKYEPVRVDGHTPPEKWAEERAFQDNRLYLKARFNHFRQLAKVRLYYENNKVAVGGWDA